ncbi:hypothetical protein ABIC35_002983 [Sphingomonas trueperi]
MITQKIRQLVDRRVPRQTLAQLPGVAPDTRETWRQRIDRYAKQHAYAPIVRRGISSRGGTSHTPVTRSNFLQYSCNSLTLLARVNVRLMSISYVAIRQAMAMIAHSRSALAAERRWSMDFVADTFGA